MRCPHCWGEQWPKCDHSGGANSAQLSLSPAIAQREHDFSFFIYFWMGGVVFVCTHWHFWVVSVSGDIREAKRKARSSLAHHYSPQPKVPASLPLPHL